LTQQVIKYHLQQALLRIYPISIIAMATAYW